MKKAWLTARALVLWAMSGIHFAVIVHGFSFFLGCFVDPRKNDLAAAPLLPEYSSPRGREIRSQALAGIRSHRARASSSCNHVNIFDPFVIYSAIPQFVRGFELESHFKIPIYGWMMGRFGNVAVPDAPTRESLADHDAAR